MALLHGSEDWYSLTRSVLDMKFLTLDDTPDSYATAAGKGLKVSSDEIALVFSEGKPDAHHIRHETPAQDQVDHGGLAGLGDDDHTQYVLESEIGASVQAHSSALDAINSTIINAVYPVGSIYTSVVATNPGTLFGVGTWSAFGAGKVMVGLDGSQTEFDAIEETGGEKTHVLSEAEHAIHTHSVNPPWVGTENADRDHAHTTNTGGASADHNHQTPASISNEVAGNVAGDANGRGVASMASVGISGGRSTDHVHSGTSGGQSQTHAHGVDIPEFTSGSKGSGYAHNNLQPYIVVYMFKRTA